MGLMKKHFEAPSSLSAEESPSADSFDVLTDAEIFSDRYESESRIPPETMRRLSRGENLFRELARLPDDYHISAEHKLLFSAISATDDHSNFPIPIRDKAIFTTFGLEYGSTRYPFTAEYQEIIHKAILKNRLSDSSDIDDFYSRLDDENSSWRVPLQRVFFDRCIPIAKQLFNFRINEINQSITELKDKRPAQLKSDKKDLAGNYIDDVGEYYEEKFKEYAINRKLLTEEEIEEYDNFSFLKIAELFERKLKTAYKNNYQGGSSKYSVLSKKYFSETKNIFRRYLAFLAQSQISSIVSSDSNLDLVSPENVHDELNSRIGATLKSTDRNGASSKGVDKCREALYRKLRQYRHIAKNTDILEFIQNSEAATSAYYGSIAPRYLDAQERFFTPNGKEMLQLEERKRALQRNKDLFINEAAARETGKAINKFQKSVAEVIFSGRKDIDNLFFFPTGVIARLESGSVLTSVISPLDDRLVKPFEDDSDVAVLWQKSWLEKQNKYDKVALSAVHDAIDREALAAKDATDSMVYDFFEHNQIKKPDYFDANTGKIYGDAQIEDIEFLEPLISHFGDFIDSVNLKTTERGVTLKSTRLEIISFLSGDSDGEFMLLCAPHRSLSVNIIRSLFDNTDKEKHDKAYSRLLSEVGVSLYNDLSGNKLKEYRTLAGDSLNISDATFYKAYGKIVSDATVRRELIERTIFIKDFIDYIKGEIDPVKASFFDSLKKKPALKG